MATSAAAAALAALYAQELRDVGPDRLHGELAHLYPWPPSRVAATAGAAVPNLHECEGYQHVAAADHMHRDDGPVQQQEQRQQQERPVDHGEFQLSPTEQDRLQQQGFVVSSRLQEPSFGEAYHHLGRTGLPVLITGDSMLHAWHRTVDAIQRNLEEQHLRPLMVGIVTQTLTAVARMKSEHTMNARVLSDVYVFLAVAKRLLQLEVQEDQGQDHDWSPASGEERVAVEELLAAVHHARLDCVSVCSLSRMIDFALFQPPRGYYRESPAMCGYFQALTWLGTIDQRFYARHEDKLDEMASLHALQCSVALVRALRDAQQMQPLNRLEALLSALVGGGGDVVSPVALDALLQRNIERYGCDALLSSDPVVSTPLLLQLVREIAEVMQPIQIDHHHHNNNLGEGAGPSPTEQKEEEPLPLLFAFCGQPVDLSAFALARLSGHHNVMFQDKPVARRIPSVSLDLGFALLANNAVVPALTTRMAKDRSQLLGVTRFRDGLPYTTNLVALRHTFDQWFATPSSSTTSSQDTQEMKTASSYHGGHSSIRDQWMALLRELSRPPPEFSASLFQSRAWGLRMLTTQMASLTQLHHHDAVTAKKSHPASPMALPTHQSCEAGYVDPYPCFWAKFQDMVTMLADLLDSIGLSVFQDCLARYKTVLSHLHTISLRQASGQRLSNEMVTFLQNIMVKQQQQLKQQQSPHSGDNDDDASRVGWYPSLFASSREEAQCSEVLVVDMHTDPPAPLHEDPGGVVHLGVGAVLMGVFLVDHVIYAGPVFSSYELTTPMNGDGPLTDACFQSLLDGLACESWATDSYLC